MRKAIGLAIAPAIAAALLFSVDGGSMSALWRGGLERAGAPTTKENVPSPADVGSGQPRTSSQAIAKKPRASRAPWDAFQKKYDEGDFRWLVDNARLFPEQGSYTYAIRALSELRFGGFSGLAGDSAPFLK